MGLNKNLDDMNKVDDDDINNYIDGNDISDKDFVIGPLNLDDRTSQLEEDKEFIEQEMGSFLNDVSTLILETSARSHKISNGDDLEFFTE